MRYKQLISGAFLLWTCIACSGKKEQAATVAEAPSRRAVQRTFDKSYGVVWYR